VYRRKGLEVSRVKLRLEVLISYLFVSEVEMHLTMWRTN
jgi:hypothetical protein